MLWALEHLLHLASAQGSQFAGHSRLLPANAFIRTLGLVDCAAEKRMSEVRSASVLIPASLEDRECR